MAKKPPLGVVPKSIFRQARMAELARGIHEYVEAGFVGGGYSDLLKSWCLEMVEIIEEDQ